jgi:hypothetical protein
VKGVAATALLIAAVAVGATTLGASGARNTTAAKSVTFHLVEKDHAFNFVDNPPRQGFNAAPLIGDQFAFTSEVLTRAGKHAGSLEATCMITRGGVNGRGVCYGAFALKGGQIFGMGLIRFSGNAPDHIAIIGGTGAYERASGDILSVSRGENSSFSDDTFHLVMP